MKGQTLIEVIVALGIIAIIVTAITAVVITSLGNAKFSKNKNLASQYAQEGLEIVRQIRDKDYESFRAKYGSITGTYCLGKNATDLASANCNTLNIDNTFIRRISFQATNCGTSSFVVQVISNVSWQDSKCSQANPFCHKVELKTCLNTAIPVPTF